MEKPTQLELKHFYAYANYGVRLTCPMLENSVILAGFGTDTDGIDKLFIHHSKYTAWYPIADFKLILKPLSDLTCHYFYPQANEWQLMDFKKKILDGVNGTLEYGAFIDLISKHFDVFGLIDAGLAVDINTLNK